MANENDIIDESQKINENIEESFDFDKMEEELENQWKLSLLI